MENELLTVKELSKTIKLSEQTIYNMINKKEFVLNRHYYKPTRKKILFIWSAVKGWLEGTSGSGEFIEPIVKMHVPESLIRI